MVKSSIQEMKLNRRGIMVVLSSPSGAGKTTLTKQILNTSRNILMSVSATTRQPRPGEVDGEDYIFLSKSKFSEMIDNDEFLEYAKVFDNFYGTPRAPVETALARGFDIVFDIDWQGAQQLTQAAANDLVKIFILPPNMRELENRLRSRAQDSDDVIARRMSKSENEISHWAEYDYIIINEDISEAIEELTTIVNAERMKRPRQPWLGSFIKKLITGG
ncbi:guanylate kinase [Hellea sp.]|jgi:guanylate kinase|nr:guanylate kinase [Hellea sp.]MDA8888370.1 guanylate kinase [Hellea sp.]MDB4845116.1 guanylate kinase [Hellea sp.]MDC0421692.1 guanylate kinase [Hellea sp.]MDC0650699.1 guanylate kinase [Hellea sp.]MDC1089523.1 guanylate kinase [Hellea sp.]